MQLKLNSVMILLDNSLKFNKSQRYFSAEKNKGYIVILVKLKRPCLKFVK